METNKPNSSPQTSQKPVSQKAVPKAVRKLSISNQFKYQRARNWLEVNLKPVRKQLGFSAQTHSAREAEVLMTESEDTARALGPVSQPGKNDQHTNQSVR